MLLRNIQVSGNKPRGHSRSSSTLKTLFIGHTARNIWKDGRDPSQSIQPVLFGCFLMSHLTPSLTSHVRHLASGNTSNGNEECGAIGTASVSLEVGTERHTVGRIHWLCLFRTSAHHSPFPVFPTVDFSFEVVPTACVSSFNLAPSNPGRTCRLEKCTCLLT